MTTREVGVPSRKSKTDQKQAELHVAYTMADVANELHEWIEIVRNRANQGKTTTDTGNVHIMLVSIWDKLPEDAKKDAMYPGWRDDDNKDTSSGERSESVEWRG